MAADTLMKGTSFSEGETFFAELDFVQLEGGVVRRYQVHLK